MPLRLGSGENADGRPAMTRVTLLLAGLITCFMFIPALGAVIWRFG